MSLRSHKVLISIFCYSYLYFPNPRAPHPQSFLVCFILSRCLEVRTTLLLTEQVTTTIPDTGLGLLLASLTVCLGLGCVIAQAALEKNHRLNGRQATDIHSTVPVAEVRVQHARLAGFWGGPFSGLQAAILLLCAHITRELSGVL